MRADVLAHGTFDVLHYGHLILFQYCRKLAGDGLFVVTVTADRFVNKGPGRPIFRQEERAAMIRSMAIVDQVEICTAASGLPMINRFKPRIYVKHAEYRTKDAHGYFASERKLVEQYGGEINFFPGRKWSSTDIIGRIAAMQAA